MTFVQRALGGALAVMAAMAAPSAASGATNTVVRLEYKTDAQDGCVGEEELRRRVTDQLGHDPFRSDADQRLAVTIVKTETGFQGRIVWTEASGRSVGERLLASRSRDCQEIAANVAFAVALQLQLVERGASNDTAPAIADGESTPPPTAEKTDRPPAVTERPSLPPEGGGASPPPSARPLVLALGAGPAVGIGMTPDATMFGRLFLAARFGGLSAEIAGDAALPVTQREPDGTGVVVDAIGSSAAGCSHVSFASVCLLGRLGWLRARGTGIAAPRTSWGQFGEVGMRVAGARELGRFTVAVHADGLVMLARWNVVLNDTVVWNVPRVGGLVGLDVALRFF